MEKENKIIAEFMQVPKCDRCTGCGWYKFGAGIFFAPEQMSYHTSWDWLMPVIQKIYTLEYFRQSEPYYNVSHCFIVAPIQTVYKLVVNFITYYNENGKG